MSSILIEKNFHETSGAEHQVQIPKEAFGSFFVNPGQIQVNIFVPSASTSPLQRSLLLSYYSQSDTYRCNWLTDFGDLGHAVIVFEETDIARTYDLWWFTGSDADTILSRQYNWNQARANQYMPQGGRRWTIISTPAPRAF